MKAILSFNLPEDNEDHYMALNGAKYRFILEDLDNYLRGLAKYEDKRSIKIEDVRKKIIELVQDAEVKII
jgi:hypothetical protein